MNTYGKPRISAWEQVHAFYEDAVARGVFTVAPMLPLLAWIKEQNLESELFPFRMFGALGISNREQFDWDHPVLRVECHYWTKTVKFEFWRHEGSSDRMAKEVSAEEACEALRQFIVHKFGIYRAPKQEPNKAPEPTTMAVTIRAPSSTARASHGRGSS